MAAVSILVDNPDLTRLLENNEPPSEATIHKVKNLLEKPMQELSGIQADIRRLENMLVDLKEKEQKTKQILAVYNRILSPARRVPPEIWSNIFYHCLPTQRNPIMSTSDAPLLLSRVCSTWRSAALSSPRLWARLHIPYACDSLDSSGWIPEKDLEERRQNIGRAMALRAEAVKQWLSRSGTCPLSLSISNTSSTRTLLGSNSQWEERITLDIFNAILPFVRRWSDLEFTIPYDIYRQLDAMLSVDMIPMLRFLRASVYERDPRGYPANTFVL
ncbi:hypothetical protein BDZ97DRAFT_2076107, partial [Flammula alnicola]